MIEIAKKYLRSGLSVIPVQIETKQPIKGFSWKKYQSELMTESDAENYFKNAEGIAVIGGGISGNLEILDFDNHFGDAKQTFTRFCNIPEVLPIIEGMVAEKTQSEGYHLLFRCSKIEPNQKIAQKLDSKGKPDTIIETRGEGGYIVAAPSPGYSLIGSCDMTSIKAITIEERKLLFEYLYSFNQYTRPDQQYHHDTFNKNDERPGDLYNKDPLAVEEVKGLLNHNGWKTTNGTHWTRPGKQKGISATFGYCSVDGIPLFYVWSSNAYPFEDRKSYKPFQIFALLGHNGDFEEAAKELVRDRDYYNKEMTPEMKQAYQKLNELNRKAIKEKAAAAEIASELNLPENQISELAKKIYEQNKDEHGFDKKTAIEKVEIWLSKNYQFRRNVVTLMVEMDKGGGWTDINIDTIFRDLQYAKIKFSKDNLASLLKSDFIADYNPFVEYFESLPPYTGENYFEKFTKYITTPNPDFFETMLRKHFVRAIKCALEDDYYNRIVFTFLSVNQEIGKSYLINWFSPFGSKYYSDEFLTPSKDSMFALAENFIYNLEELDTLSKMEVGKLKATISKRGVKDRPAYASQKIFMPRRCTFFGSTNREEFLTDDSNTRWLVFKSDKINWNYSKDNNIDDLWAEAYAYYKDPDFNCELTPQEKGWRDTENDKYQVAEVERSLIIQHFEAAPHDQQYMTNSDIMIKLGEIVAGRIRLTTTPQKIGRILTGLGFASGQKMINGKNCRVYYVVQKDKPYEPPVGSNELPY